MYVPFTPLTVLSFLTDSRDTPLLQHETGGLALARQLDPLVYPTYAYFPEKLENVTHSTIYLGEHVVTRAANSGGEVDERWLREEIFGRGLGIEDATEEEVRNVQKGGRQDSVEVDRV